MRKEYFITDEDIKHCIALTSASLQQSLPASKLSKGARKGVGPEKGSGPEKGARKGVIS